MCDCNLIKYASCLVPIAIWDFGVRTWNHVTLGIIINKFEMTKYGQWSLEIESLIQVCFNIFKFKSPRSQFAKILSF
jgi:hypothetical protein